jgi:predicted transcriptional regulator
MDLMPAYSVSIEPKLAERLEEAAQTRNLSPAQLIAECVEHYLDIAVRHRALVERLDIVDQGLLELANFIGEATAGGSTDVSSLCRYSPHKA